MMIDNPPDSSATVRRYAPPSQRNRLLSRRKSGDRFDRINNPYGYEGEKSQAASSRNIPILDHAEAGGSDLPIENPHLGLISIDGCSGSVAAQLLTDRWTAAMHSYNDPSIDLSERPVMYSGSGASAWGHSRLSNQMDFLTELRRKISDANSSVDA